MSGAKETKQPTIVLGSRSPQRRALLELIVPASSIVVRPPTSHVEPGFDDIHDWSAIDRRLCEVVRLKMTDVRGQIAAALGEKHDLVLCADTVIVAQDEAGEPVVLGQPPADDTWSDVVRDWFLRYYRGRTHWAATAVCIAESGANESRSEGIVRTQVTFTDFNDALLDWYLSTGESRGKAGGYALQGAASIFVSRIEGSPSNVIGLPLRETLDLLRTRDPFALAPGPSPGGRGEN